MKIAFVCPFFGEQAAGGAEFAARSVALHLADSGIGVDVLTTCLHDLPHGLTNNVHPAGVSQDGPLTIMRFSAEVPDMSVFPELNDLIIDGGMPTAQEELQFVSRHVNSIDLIRYLADNEADYDWLCFIPYLFGTTVFGAQVAPHKSIMIPCLHDEGYARLQLVRDAIARVHRLVFNSEAEAHFAKTAYGIDESKGVYVGLGVETDIEFDASRFRDRFDMDDPFVLYAGRRDTTKNVHTLIQHFERYKQRHPSPLKLVLIGPADLPVSNPSKDIVDLGFVTEQEKRDAYAAATLFCQPSKNESFSYVMMEAWLCGTPCLVHEACAVTRDHVVRSGGGLFFDSAVDFEGSVDLLLSDADLRARMAASGRRYVLENFAWSRIVQRFREEVFRV
ncbi:MAG: glycosyltransferase family 4 protein [Verrucomicrobia bacterium]|nr:glycosyltransferase family 4 protein [Verrucomicrobiota bacterium]